MAFRLTRRGGAILGCAAALVLSPATASADLPDPHQPDMTKGFCPGGRWGYGNLAVCDGEKYPDGSFWHQWMKTWIVGPQFYYDCVGGDEPLARPATARWLWRGDSARSAAGLSYRRHTTSPRAWSRLGSE